MLVSDTRRADALKRLCDCFMCEPGERRAIITLYSGPTPRNADAELLPENVALCTFPCAVRVFGPWLTFVHTEGGESVAYATGQLTFCRVLNVRCTTMLQVAPFDIHEGLHVCLYD